MPQTYDTTESDDTTETLENGEEYFEEFKAEDMDDDTILRAFLRRNDSGDMVLYLESTQELEDFFDTGRTGESSHWYNPDDDAHTYYKRSYNYDDFSDDNSDLAEYFHTKNDTFGNSYVQNDKINVGLLRTVGLSDGVEFKIPDSYSQETMEESIRMLKEEVERLHKQFIRPVNVMTEISVQEY